MLKKTSSLTIGAEPHQYLGRPDERQPAPSTDSPSTDSIDWRPVGILWLLALAIWLITAGWLALSSVNLAVDPLLARLVMPVIFAVIAPIYIFFRPAPRLALTALAIAQIWLFSLAAPIYSYLVMGIGRPYVDEILARCDMLLGFDWVAYAGFIHHQIWLDRVSGWLYQTSPAQAILLAAIFGFSGRFASLHRLLAGLFFSLVVAITIGALLPALGAYHHYGAPDLGGSKYDLAIAAAHDGRIRSMDIRQMIGIIQFPSYHTAVSAILVITSWPIAYLRYPVLLWNCALIIGVPVYGEHYLVDMICGLLLAILVDRLWCRAHCKSAYAT